MNLSAQKPQLHHWKKTLILLLVAQVLLIMGIYAWHQHHQPRVEAKALLAFPTTEVDKLVIHDANNQVTLKKSGTDWLLPAMNNLPVDTQKLNALLDKLQGTKLTWPVTTTSSSHERFEVSASKFQRRVEFYQGEKKAGELLLGTSPGFKKIHVRRDGEEEVYAAELTSVEFSATDKEWLEKELLAIKDPVLVGGMDYVLQKQDNTWVFENDADTKVDNTKATALANAIASFNIQDLATSKPEGVTTNMRVKSDAGDFRYEFIKAGDNYLVKRDDKEGYFTLSQYEYDQVAKLQKADLVAPPETGATSSQQTSSTGK